MANTTKEGTSTSTTRSGRHFSGAGSNNNNNNNKRKRTEDDNQDPNPSRSKMSSPSKIPPNATGSFTWDQLTTFMTTKLEANKKEMLDGINSKIDAQELNLEKHKKEVREELNQLRSDVAALANDKKQPGAAANATPSPYRSALLKDGTPRSPSAHEMKQYWYARTCIRCWNIDGDNDEDRMRNLQRFFQQAMKIPSSELSGKDIISVRRVQLGRNKQPRGEVIVAFDCVETRDRVVSYARNLGSFVGPDNKPTAGIRPEVPSHLGGVHCALLQYGHDMRRRYGTSFKRNIRFDDADHTMVIDVLIPGHDNPRNEWVTVSYARAVADRRARANDLEKSRGNMLSSYQKEDGVDIDLAAEDVTDKPSSSGQRGQAQKTKATGTNACNASWSANVDHSNNNNNMNIDGRDEIWEVPRR